MADWENMYKNMREKSAHVGSMALHVGEFGAGAVACGYLRGRKGGMPQLMGRDASLVVGAVAVGVGLLLPDVKYTEDLMYVGAGMLAEKGVDWGRKLAEKKPDGAGYGYAPAQLSQGTSAEAGLHHILAARRAMANAGLADDSASTARRSRKTAEPEP